MVAKINKLSHMSGCRAAISFVLSCRGEKKASEEQICLSVLQALISDDNNDLFELSKRGLKQKPKRGPCFQCSVGFKLHHMDIIDLHLP